MGKPKSRKQRLVLTTTSESDGFSADEIVEANISKVLACIFRRLPYASLLRARLACRDWNRVICAYTHLPAICQVVVRGDPDEILGAFLTAEHRPWTNFRFITPLMDNSSLIQLSFWVKFGGQVESLDFVIHSLGPAALLEVLIACPNLKELSFSSKRVYNYNPPKSNYEPIIIPQYCQNLIPRSRSMLNIRILENLTRLKIMDSNFAPPGIIRDILERSTNLTQLTLYDTNRTAIPHWDARNILHLVEQRAGYLTKLEITGCHVLPEHITALSKLKKLKLKSLHLRCAIVTDLSLIGLFRRQNELEELDLSGTRFSERAFLNTDCTFQRIRKLNLSEFTPSVSSFGFLCRMPNLTELTLSSSAPNGMNWEQLVSCMLPIRLKRMQTLDLSCNNGLGVFPRSNYFSSLMTLYSHVTCLNLSGNNFLKDMTIHEIWRHMRSVRVVFLENLKGITNEAFSGIRQVQIQAFLSNGSMEKVNPDLLRYQNTGGSYIGLCQKIEIMSIAYNPRITDLSTIFGFRDLWNLRKLNIAGCNQITHQSLVELVTFCPFLEYLDLTGIPIPEYWVQWAKEKRPKLRRVIGKIDNKPQVVRNRPLIANQAAAAAAPVLQATPPVTNALDKKSEAQASRPSGGPTGEGS